MKIGVIGAGAVGSACLLSIVMRGAACEIVVVNRDRKRATAVATDLQYGASLSPVIDIRDGDYSVCGCGACHGSSLCLPESSLAQATTIF
jgi:L-lactate dehydrogenase